MNDDDLRTTQTCRYCGQEFPINVMVCYHCGREKPSVSALRAKPVAPPTVVKKPMSFMQILLIGGAVGLFGCCGGIGVLVNMLPKLSPEQKAESKAKWDAMVEANDCEKQLKDHIKKKLKTPSVAEFALEQKKIGRWMFLIDGTVTSRNSFNAPITSKISGVFGREVETGPLEFWGYTFDNDDIVMHDKVDRAMAKVKRDAGGVTPIK